MKNSTRMIGLAGAGVMVLSLAFLPACSVIRSRNEVSVTGQPMSKYTLGKLEVGSTTEEQVMDLLGPPTRTMACDDGRTLVYEYKRQESGSGSLLFVFRGSSEKAVSRTAYVEIDDGVVQKWWLDEG